MGSYDLKLVALSYVVSAFGSYIALHTAKQILEGRIAERVFWVSGAALAMGGIGIWSMHFIGMVAFKMRVPVSYGIGVTVASLLLALIATGIGFWAVAGRARSRGRYAVAGVAMGLGISGMHYTGMAAMQMPATVSYSPVIVAASVVIGIVASTAALWLSFNLQRTVHMVGSALVMGGAVCGMHYTGMAAARFRQTDEIVPLAGQALRGDALAYLVFMLAIVILSVQIGASAGRRAERAADVGAGTPPHVAATGKLP